MPKINSRRKGICFERDLAAYFRKEGIEDAKRGLSQTRNGSEVPDVDIPYVWVEAKNQVNAKPFDALRQAEECCKDVRLPVAICKCIGSGNLNDSYVTMRLGDWIVWYKNHLSIMESMKEKFSSKLL